MLDERLPFRTIVGYTLLTIGLLFVVIYVIFQARYLIIGPQITLENTPELLQNERQIFLSGTALGA